MNRQRKPTTVATPDSTVAILGDLSCAAIVGLDIGFGVVKAITHTGKTAIFPSVAGHARQLSFHADKIAERYPGDQLADAEGEWFIGDLALTQLLQGEVVRLRGRNANDHGTEFRLRMAKAALGKLFAGLRGGDSTVINVQIATGLPVAHMTDAALIKAQLIGAHRIQTDQSDFIVNISKVMVMPQAYAAIYTKLLTEAGEINRGHVATETAVIDVGTYTVDFARDSDGTYQDVESGSAEAGVYNVHERVARGLQDHYKQEFGYKVVEAAIREGCIKIAGKVEDCTEMVEEAMESLRAATVSKAYELWKDAKHIEEIYLMGGGASLVADDLIGYPQLQTLPNPQWANARGYLNFALFKAAE